jgi:hypothetical protein
LNAKTQRTYDQVFQHPITHNLDWRDIRAMFESLGMVEQEHNGNLKVTLHDHVVVFQSPNESKAASADQVSLIRHLLETHTARKPDGSAPHLLVVIDRSEARIYHTEIVDSVPERVVPYDPLGNKGHVHSSHAQPGHKAIPHDEAYYEGIAKCLADAEQILVFGSGEGSSSAADAFVGWLKVHHQNLADRIMGSVKVDQGHCTEGQLLAEARTIYGRNPGGWSRKTYVS